MKANAFSFLLLVLFLPTAQCSNRQKNYTSLDVSAVASDEGDTIINRKPAVAGSFYPGNRDALMKQIAALFKDATSHKKLDNVVALISPHAGYVYSGKVAASAYNQLSPDKKFDNIFIIGASHYVGFGGAAIYCDGNFTTPLGIARVNIPLSRKIIQENPTLFVSNADVHTPEHSIEVQIPFLQYLYKDELQIIPILLGTQKPATIQKIAEALKPYFKGSNLFVISTDFSHYPVYQEACQVDALTADAIVGNSSAAFLKTIKTNESKGIPNLATSICGWTGVLTLLDITENDPDIHYTKLNYMNSGDAPDGDKTRVVGYHAIAVTSDTDVSKANQSNYSLTKEEKDQLLRIARKSIDNYLESGNLTKIDTKGFSDKLLTHAGAFVTLNLNGQLRGCIGQFTADIPLYQVVQEMAISAATRDNRFRPLTTAELNHTDIEISVLTPMQRIQSIDVIELGRHGIYIRKGNRGGTFLPQVANQTGWTREEFLGHCARDKAGIGWDGWKDAEIYVYEAYVFGE
ncbi:MAG: AmmeMemoRadiSam system protein B [Bacteroidales bacterium]|nr:AmmeMemoRadiSam system protein B [Bacteroidales bacterium]